MRRLRIRFAKQEQVRYVSHLDLMRTWERTFRRAAVRVCHTQGFSPRPRLVFAAPLSVGATSDCELVDVFLEDDVSPGELDHRLAVALPPGLAVMSIDEPPINAPSVMAQVRAAEYMVDVRSLAVRAEAESKLHRLLGSSAVEYERRRKDTTKRADLRPAVLDIWIVDWGEARRLGMLLRLDVEGLAAKPAEVVRAIDAAWQVVRVHRTQLILKPHLTELPSKEPSLTYAN